MPRNRSLPDIPARQSDAPGQFGLGRRVRSILKECGWAEIDILTDHPRAGDLLDAIVVIAPKPHFKGKCLSRR
jgi:hypothetical protein